MSLLAFEHGAGGFAGHETFAFRYTWLPKAIAGVAANPSVFGSEDALVEFGVGKNMVKSMRHWGLACGVLEEDPEVSNNRGRQLRATELGRQLFGPSGWDPFMEDPATLWLLHWQLASNPSTATTWYWVFNHLPQPEFSRAQLHSWLMGLAAQHGWGRISEASLKRDVDCFLRTYVPLRATKSVALEETLDCPLVELGLIREIGGRGNYLLMRGDQATLPDAVFAYALTTYLMDRPKRVRTEALDAIAFAPGSPGRVFALSEDGLMMRLERLTRVTRGALTFDETAGLRQVVTHREEPPLTFLHSYYAPRASRGDAA